MRMSMRKVGLFIATALLGFGVLGMTSPAHADTTWGCPGCARATPHPR
jgi:hypothetical protein